MARVFNLGVGMIAVVPEADSYKALDVLRSNGQRATVIGSLVPGTGEVHLSERTG
jgi:phosphoribosylaminoimidazole (AIR) synthetase